MRRGVVGNGHLSEIHQHLSASGGPESDIEYLRVLLGTSEQLKKIAFCLAIDLRMQAILPSQLLALAKTGRPPLSVELMLRIHYLQQWFCQLGPGVGRSTA